MGAPEQIDAGRLVDAGGFVGSLRPTDLVLFVANVGDADAQLLLLPEDDSGTRKVVIIDAGRRAKLPALLAELISAGLVAGDTTGVPAAGAVALMVATHPHSDHIAGIAELFSVLGDGLGEYWDSGYYHPSADYFATLAAIDASPARYAQPAAGMRLWIDDVAITVLSPAIGLRNRFDSYGIDINNASISLRVESPAARVIRRNDERELLDDRRSTVIVLGADAQTLSWSYVMADFPALGPDPTPANRAIGAATGADQLSCSVFKVSHHGSKHGVNLELIERLAPAVTVVSSVGSGGKYNFPHDVAQRLIREARKPNRGTGTPNQTDADLNIFYTADTDTAGDECGTVAVVCRPTRRTVWRFGDRPDDPIDLSAGRRWQP